MKQSVFQYGVEALSIGTALDLARGQTKGILTEAAYEKIRIARSHVEEVLDNKQIVYGVNTGFGPLCTTRVSAEKVQLLQANLLKSHAVGVGEPIPLELAKLMMILKVHALAQGYSGVSLPVIGRLLLHIEEDAIPWVPAKGSVGASGDLAPLAHLFLPLLGFGKVHYQGSWMEAEAFLNQKKLAPIDLQAKDALSLINGTQFMAAFGVKLVQRIQQALDQADIIAAMMLEALAGSQKPFTAMLHNIRPHPGCQYVAERFRTLLKDSEIMTSHIGCSRVQDPYSLRCIPQVHGASRQAWLHLKEAILTEINSVTDNPIILGSNHIISGGNFHGQPIALPMDYAAMAAAELGNISDRRIYLSLEGKFEGVPKLLLKETGLNSGFMIPQYTTASLVTENKTLCFPASVDSIPTSIGQEDHVSMGATSARKAMQVVDNLESILAIELMCAVQALGFREPLKSGPLLQACYEYVRSQIKHREQDELFMDEMDFVIDTIRKGKLIDICREAGQSKNIKLKNEDHEVYGIY
jgi:histidine ammonia-lyase